MQRSLKEGMTMQGEFVSYDSKKIFYRRWIVDNPRAIIQIYHGLGEMAFYYEEFASQANAKGFSVYLHEYRGHGRTGDKFNEEDIFSQYIKDALIFHTFIQRETPKVPIFLLAHSLGTKVAQGVLYQYPEFYQGAVLIGIPEQRFDKDVWKTLNQEISQNGLDAPNVQTAVRLYGHLNDDFAAENSSLAWLTRDSKKREFYETLTYTNVSYSNRFYRDLFVYQDRLKTQGLLQVKRKDLPLLILTGGEDIVAAHGSYGAKVAGELLENGFTGVTEKTYPGYRHSILQEIGRELVTDDILSWIGRYVQE